MHTDWLIIDGYSLLHRDAAMKHLLSHNMDTARQRLLQKLEPLVRDMADRVTIVFDGRQGNTDQRPFESELIEVRFSPRHLTADSVIERLVAKAKDPEDILVVTSDRAERDTVSASGAHVMSCGLLLAICEGKQSGHRQQVSRYARGHRPATLGDFFP